VLAFAHAEVQDEAKGARSADFRHDWVRGENRAPLHLVYETGK